MDTSTEHDQRLARLMGAAQDGDAGAYAALLGDVAPLLRRFVRGRFAFLQPSDVEDLVQDVLLSLHTARATYDAARPFLPWLMAIARNRMADGARRYARRVANEQACAQPETFAADAANTFTEGYRDAQALARAVAELPSGQRQAIELIKLREMSLKEASAVTGTNIGALKVAVHRGMHALRKALGPKG